MFGRKRSERLRATLRARAEYNIQLDVDFILIHAMSQAIRDHPEWIPTAQDMLNR